jgi:cytochrome c peroxidase
MVLLGLVLTGATIDLNDLFDYSDDTVPSHIFAGAEPFDTAPPDNAMDDRVATLGRVLFYDKTLSSNNGVSCSSCHQQTFAFGSHTLQGTGVNGASLRRPMRLLNLRNTPQTLGLFWDERTATLEELATQPIRDHLEMGNSGTDGDPSFEDLIEELEGLERYQQLFPFAFGDAQITEERIAKALAQFVRSIRSYDSRFDEGLAAVGNDLEADFPNFTAEENAGKTLFTMDPWSIQFSRIGGGAGCFRCHGTDPRTLNFISGEEPGNNGVITEIDGSEVLDITKAPSLRDLFGPDGTLNGPLFHNGQALSIGMAMDHYDSIPSNPGLDERQNILRIRMNFTPEEVTRMEAFLRTLTGSAIYTDERWSDPFDANGDLDLIGLPNRVSSLASDNGPTIHPNPADEVIHLKGLGNGSYLVRIRDTGGRSMSVHRMSGDGPIDITHLDQGLFLLEVRGQDGGMARTARFIKR